MLAGYHEYSLNYLPNAEAYWFLFVTPCWFSQFFVYFKKPNAESNAKYFKIVSSSVYFTIVIGKNRLTNSQLKDFYDFFFAISVIKVL